MSFSEDDSNFERATKQLKLKLYVAAFGTDEVIFDARTSLASQWATNFVNATLSEDHLPFAIAWEQRNDDRWLFDSASAFLVFRESDRKGSVYEIRDLLLTQQSRVRAAALGLLSSIVERFPEVISPYSLRLLRSLRESVLSDNPAVWARAAVQLYDTLGNDVFYVLSGLRQAVEMPFQKGIEDYWQRLFKPNIEILSHMEGVVTAAVSQKELIEKTIENILSETTSPTQALNRYVNSLGHLPLSEEFSAASLLRRMLEATPGHNASTAWADISNNLLPGASFVVRYHVCQAFLGVIEQLPGPESQRILSDAMTFITDGLNDDINSSDVALHQLFARYYCHYFATELPDSTGEALASLSLWLSKQLLNVISVLGERTMTFDKASIKQQLELCRQLELFCKSQIKPSGLKYLLQNDVSPWTYGLLKEMSKRPVRDLPITVSDEAISIIRKFVKASVLEAPFCVSNEEKIYTYSTENGSLAEYIPAGETQLFNQLQSEVRESCLHELGENEVLKRFLEDEEKLPFTSLLLRNLAYCGFAPAKMLREQLLNQKKRNRLLVDASEPVAAILVEVLIEIQSQKGGEWHLELPHIFSIACNEASDLERKYLLWTAAVLSSNAAQSVSAIERMREENNRGTVMDMMAWSDSLLLGAYSRAPEWMRGRFRQTLSALQ